MTDEYHELERKYHWIVLFGDGGKVYTYMYRTVPYMTEVIKKFRAEHGKDPFRVWVIIDGEIQKVVIS